MSILWTVWEGDHWFRFYVKFMPNYARTLPADHIVHVWLFPIWQKEVTSQLIEATSVISIFLLDDQTDQNVSLSHTGSTGANSPIFVWRYSLIIMYHPLISCFVGSGGICMFVVPIHFVIVPKIRRDVSGHCQELKSQKV